MTILDFQPDGRAVLTGETNEIRITPIPRPIEGGPRTLVDRVRARTGLELDDRGGLGYLDASSWESAKKAAEGAAK